MTEFTPLRGLVAATFTPLFDDGSLKTEAIPPMVEHLVRQRIAGLYVLGSTGEGSSLTRDERCRVAEEFIRAAAGRLPVIVQVGCECLADARRLAAHAQEAGADAVSAVCPVYFKPDSLPTLVDAMAEIASAAPDLPFYYYHIPAVTGASFSMLEFLHRGGEALPTLWGVKFTAPQVHQFQACVETFAGRFELLWGVDEMLSSGLVAGGTAAVGSTYNFAAPISQRLIDAFARGDLEAARGHQAQSQQLVRTFVPYGPRAAQKAIMALIGMDCGPTRLPVRPLSPSELADLRRDLEQIGFFRWIESGPVA